jgi:hypothetical protein
LAALPAALASGLLLLLAGFLLATAALLTALTRLLFLLPGLLTTATLLATLARILISHDHVSPAGKFPQTDNLRCIGKFLPDGGGVEALVGSLRR